MRATQALLAQDFLSRRRIALVGVSRDARDLSRAIFRELRTRGYDVVPVHPEMSVLEGVPCARRVQDIQPPVDGALLMTPPPVTETVVRDCAAAKVPRIWMHQGVGPGAVSPQAVAFCREHGIAVVEGACLLMLLPGAGWIHRTHGGLARLLGHHPSQRVA
jgi:predicted CoA-binding protein